MLITVKKSTLIALAAAFAVIVTAAAVYAKKADKEIPPLNIVVDPGHGGMDGGAVGHSGTLEKDVNLAVSKMLCGMLEARGASVSMTRNEDISLHDESANTVREQKRSDLSKRKALAGDDKTDIFLSIHMNKFEQSQYRGAQVFYADNEESRRLADCIRTKLVKVSEKSDGRELKKAYGTMYILKETNNPAVIVECGFLSNPEEEQLLLSESYQKKIAKAITDGVCAYVKANEK